MPEKLEWLLTAICTLEVMIALLLTTLTNRVFIGFEDHLALLRGALKIVEDYDAIFQLRVVNYLVLRFACVACSCHVFYLIVMGAAESLLQVAVSCLMRSVESYYCEKKEKA